MPEQRRRRYFSKCKTSHRHTVRSTPRARPTAPASLNAGGAKQPTRDEQAAVHLEQGAVALGGAAKKMEAAAHITAARRSQNKGRPSNARANAEAVLAQQGILVAATASLHAVMPGGANAQKGVKRKREGAADRSGTAIAQAAEAEAKLRRRIGHAKKQSDKEILEALLLWNMDDIGRGANPEKKIKLGFDSKVKILKATRSLLKKLIEGGWSKATAKRVPALRTKNG